MSSVRRSIWLSLADSYLGLVLQIVSTMVIARVLKPAEIGVFAIAAVFSGLASMFRDFGVAEYMIQERELTSEKIAAALSLNIMVSWSMSAAMFLGSGFVADFYKNDGVGTVMRIQAIGFLLVPFGAVTMAWFRREMNFRPVLICNLAGNLTAFATAVGLALAGFGYLGLAWSTVASIVVIVVISVAYRPAGFPRVPSLRGIAPVFHFSKFVTSMWIVGQAGKGAPEMIIGRASGVVDVAMFSRASGLLEMFNRLVMRSVSHVGMPYFAKSDRETGSVAAAYIRTTSYVTALGWPFFAFLAVGAFAAVRIVYGDQWDAAVPVAQVLCLAGALDIVHAMARDALLVRGRAREGNRLQLILVALQVSGLLLVVPFGLMGAAWGAAGAAAAGLVVTQYFLVRHIGLSTTDLMRGCLPSAFLCMASVAPALLWALVEDVTKENFIRFGIAGGLLTVAAWLVALHILRHPLLEELESVKQRLSSWIRRT